MEQDRTRSTSMSVDALTAMDPKVGRTADDSSFALLRNNIIEAVRILVLRRWVFFVPFCTITCLGAIASHWVARTYESDTVIERRDHPVLMNLRQTAATGGFARFFRPTLLNDLTTLDTLAEVAAKAGLVDDVSYDADGKLTSESAARCRAKGAELAGGVSVRLLQKSDYFDQIKITFSSSDSSLPYRVVDALKNAYIQTTRARLTDLLQEGKSYFESVAEERRAKATALEEDLLSFQAEYIGIDPTNPGALKLKLTSLETERDELLREIDNLQREADGRRHMLDLYKQRTEYERTRTLARGAAPQKTSLPSMAKSADAHALEDEIRTLQAEIHELQLVRRMTDRHPDIADRRARIERLRERLKAQYLADARSLPANRGITLDDATAASVVDAAVGWDVELAGMQMGLQDRISRIEAAQARIQVVEGDIAKHKALEDNIFRYRKEYKLKADLLAQAQEEYNANSRRALEIASILDADESERGISFAVITPPTPCYRPVTPRGMTVLVFSVLAGLAAGAVCVLLRELFDQTYHTSRQVTRSLGLALLESVDEIVTSLDRARLFRRRVLYAPVIFTFLVAIVGVSCAAAYLSIEQPRRFQQAMEKPRRIWSQFVADAGQPGRDRQEAGQGQPPRPEIAPLDSSDALAAVTASPAAGEVRAE